MRHLLFALCLSVATTTIHAHPGDDPVASWTFVPKYTLPGNGDQTLGPRPLPPESPRDPVAYTPAPVSLFGMTATDRVIRLIERDGLPEGAFTVEMWVLDHVNRPVGAFLGAKGYGPGDDVAWGVGYADGRAHFEIGGGAADAVEIGSPTRDVAFKRYWRHIVGVFDGVEARLYVNGRPMGSAEIERSVHEYDPQAQLELAVYTEHEPFMTIGNLVHAAAVYDSALPEDHIRSRYVELSTAVERGILFPGRFHFTVGPYLNMTTKTSTALLWETDRPTTATLLYGELGELDRSIEFDTPSRVHDTVIEGLDPATLYYYKVVAEDSSGAKIDSGLLTFQTAVEDDQPFSFAIIGDTEARPHVNHQIISLIWEQRPNFVINCGDLTDGGKRDHRFQWTHEYFLGVGALHARVPVFPVAGNGEGDLHWYKHYHALPEPEGYYSFRYGDAEFFMLDSNRRGDGEFRPGGEQYDWLDKKLSESTARWKFAAHHHPTVTSDENDFGDTWTGADSPLGDTDVMPIMKLYEKHGVDAVFFGHLHSFERSWPLLEGKVSKDEGVVYIQTGGAGGNLEDFRPAKTWFNHKAFRGHHFCMISIHGDNLEFRLFNQDGSLRDVARISKLDDPYTEARTD